MFTATKNATASSYRSKGERRADDKARRGRDKATAIREGVA